MFYNNLLAAVTLLSYYLLLQYESYLKVFGSANRGGTSRWDFSFAAEALYSNLSDFLSIILHHFLAGWIYSFAILSCLCCCADDLCQ